MKHDTRRLIAGLHVEEDGRIGVVWISVDDLGVFRVKDAALFRNEHFAVVADGIAARGRWVPIAWGKSSEAFVAKLKKDYGCRTLTDPCSDNEAFVKAMTNQLVQALTNSRLRVESPTIGEWLNEYDQVQSLGDVPKDGYPLMSATRYAMEEVKRARPNEPKRKQIKYDARGVV